MGAARSRAPAGHAPATAPGHRRSAQAKVLLDERLPLMVAADAAGEPAVGMRLVYGVTADKARQLLVWRAQETGLPIGEFARLLCAAVTGRGELAPAWLRVRFDDLLLTVHERVTVD